MRLMGLDIGSKTVGVAVSDPLGWTAQAVEIIPINEDEEVFGLDRVAELAKKEQVAGFVLGLPKNMNRGWMLPNIMVSYLRSIFQISPLTFKMNG